VFPDTFRKSLGEARKRSNASRSCHVHIPANHDSHPLPDYPVRWLGWIMTLGILTPDPGFLLVVLLSPFWLFMLGRWMKRLALNPTPVSF
jgi:hypothetical protein